MKTLLALAAAPALALTVGTGIATASVSATELQEMISSQLASQAGTPPDAVNCPSDLDPTLGSSVTCAVSLGDQTQGVTVTVESVDDGQVGLSMKLAQQ